MGGAVIVNIFLQPVVAHIFIEIRRQLVIEILHKPIESILTKASVRVGYCGQ